MMSIIDADCMPTCPRQESRSLRHRGTLDQLSETHTSKSKLLWVRIKRVEEVNAAWVRGRQTRFIDEVRFWLQNSESSDDEWGRTR